MTILVMRPSPAGEQLVNRLRAMGRVAYHVPLIDLQPGRELQQLPTRLQALRPGHLVFLLSQHAVRYANALLSRNRLSWPSELLYYAIGHTTALALHTISGLQPKFPSSGVTSEALLSLPDLQVLDGKNALILRGNGGRTLLGDTLISRGAKVVYCECYRRSPICYDGNKQSAHWQRASVDTLVVTSGEMLQQLYNLIPDNYRSWLLRCRLIVVSERLAAFANQLGWNTIQVAKSAGNDALIHALQ